MSTQQQESATTQTTTSAQSGSTEQAPASQQQLDSTRLSGQQQLPSQTGSIDLEKLRIGLNNIALGLDRGCRNGAYGLNEAKVLADNVEYLVSSFTVLEKLGQQQAQAQQQAQQASPAPAVQPQ